MEARESSSKAMKRLGMKLSAIAPCPRAVWCGARLLFAVSVIGCSVQAQEATSTPDRTPRAQRPGTIQAVSEEVLLDLVARDRHGRAVRDLEPNQIEVYEDGVRQEVTSFRLVEGEAPAAAPETIGRASASDVLRQISLVSLLFERLGDEGRRHAREAALDFLKSELRPNVYVAVFTSDTRLYILQRFTNDRRLLEQAADQATTASSRQIASQSESVFRDLERASSQLELANQGAALALSQDRPGPATGAAIAAMFAQITVNMLRTADMLTRNHEGRFSLDALISLVHGQRALRGRKTIIYFCEGLRLTPALMEQFRSTVSEANRSNVSIYSVDARGLVLSEVGGAAHEIMLGAESASHGAVYRGRAQELPGEGIIAGESENEYVARANVQDSLADLSASTGGFLIANTNEMGAAMRRIADDIRGYYEAAYRPSGREYDGKFHRITVKVLRPGITLQTRSGYFSFPPVSGAPVLSFEAPMFAALASRRESADFDYHASALHFGTSPAGTLYELVIEVPLSAFTFVRNAEKTKQRTHFSLLSVVKDAEGRVAERFSQDYPLEIPQEKIEAAKKRNVTFTPTIHLTPGRYTVETAAMDQATGKVGVLRSVLIVPPPAVGVGLSSVSVVGRVDSGAPGFTGSEDPLQFQNAKIIPNLGDPISKASSTGLPIYLIVYPSSEISEKPRMELEFLRGGQVVAVSNPQLPAPDVEGRIAYLATVPMDKLEPGRYVIRALVRQGSAAAEEYAFFSVNP